MRVKPIVMPTMLEGEGKSTARKLHVASPSMPPGTILWIEVDRKWINARVRRIDYATLHVERISA
jgi:hypothetical protein